MTRIPTLRRVAASALWLLAIAFGAPPAHAGGVTTGCALEALAPLSQSGEPGDSVQFSFQLIDDGAGTCNATTGTLTGTVHVENDTGDASASIPAASSTWSANFGDTVTIDVDLGPMEGTATIVPECLSCSTALPPAEFFTTTAINPPDLTLTKVSPPDGTVAYAGDSVTLVAHLADEDGSDEAGTLVEWNIIGNPNGSSFGGPFNGATIASLFSDGNGEASVELVIGAPNAPPHDVQVQALIFPGVVGYERSVTFVIAARDTLSLASANAGSDNQQVRIGEALAVPFEVRATRNAVPDSLGRQVEWSVAPAGALVLSQISTPTDSGGIASITAVAGSTPGPFTVTASHVDDPTQTVTFTGLVKQYTIGKPATGSGDAQTGTPGSTLPSPLRAIVYVNGSPMDDVPIHWRVVSGSATLTGTNPALSASDGSTEIGVTLGGTAGSVVIRAELNDDSSIFTEFTATIDEILLELGKPASESGDGQSAPAGSPLPLPLKALATNDGLPADGVTVNWEVTSGSADFAPNPSVTDDGGIAGVSVTLGPTPGTVVVSATRADNPSAKTVYTLEATGTEVLSLEKPATGSGDGQEGYVGDAVIHPLVVIARNDGDGVAGVTVEWSVTGGDATLDAATSISGSGGRAAIGVTFGDTPGSVSITARRADAPLATSSFVLTSQPQPDAVFTLVEPDDSGNGGSAAPGGNIDLAARVLRDGANASLARVTWEVLSGDATVRPALSTSNSSGIARSRVELGATTGDIVVRASLTDHPDATPLVYHLRSEQTATPTLSIVSGDAQTGIAGSALEPLVVRYADAAGPIANATVTWSVVEGQASLGAATTQTGSDGQSSVAITLGLADGPVQVRATAGDSSVTFLLVATGDDTLTLVKIDGDGQRGAIGTAVDAPLVVEVRDSSGAPVASQTVLWDAMLGGATISATETVTDGSGRAQVQARFGSTAGVVMIRATLPGQGSEGVVFQLEALQPSLRIVSGNGQSGPANAPLADDFVVELVLPAAPAKALGGVHVRWQVLDGGGVLDVVDAVTDASGRARARLTLGPATGPQRVSAQVGDGDSVVFTAQAEAAGDDTLEAVSGSGQTLVTQAPSAPLVVLVRDAAGAPAAGVEVQWSADNADLQSATSISGSDGRASNVARVLLPGAATITATLADGGASADFVLNAGIGNLGGLDQTEEGIADAIDRFCPELAAASNLTPAQQDLRLRCLELVNNAGSNPDDVRDALDALRQDVAMGQSNAAYAAVGAQFDNLKTRIAALRAGSSGIDLGGLAVATGSGVLPLSLLPAQESDTAGGAAASDAEIGGDFSRWGFFASGVIGRGSQDGDSATPEYDFDSAGLTAGVDYRVNDQVIVGVSAGWNRQDTTLAHDRGGIDTRGWSVSAYSTWYRDNAWYMDAVATLGSNDYDLDRRILYTLQAADGGVTRIDQLARASTGGDQRSLALSFGRDVQVGPWSLGPYLRGTLTRIDFDGYSEQTDADLPGAGLGLAVDARELESRTGVLGGKASYAMSRDWGILIPHLQLEWEHEFQDDPDTLVARFLHDPTRTAIRTDGEALDTDYYNLGLGLSALFPGGRSAFLYYERLIGASGQSQDNLSLGVRFEF